MTAPHPQPMVIDTSRLVEAAACLQLDQVGLAKLVADVDGALHLHQLRDPVVRNLPTRRKIVERANSELLYIEQSKKRIIKSLILMPASSEQASAKAQQLGGQLHDLLSEVEGHIKRELATFGEPGSRSKTNAGKPSRALLWADLLEIWKSNGGQQTGNKTANFLMAASLPSLGAEIPTKASVVEWLRRHRSRATRNS